MTLIFHMLIQVLLVLVTLECYQARLKHSDQGTGYIANSYTKESDAMDPENKDFLLGPSKDEAKNIDNIYLRQEDVETPDKNKEIARFSPNSSEKKRKNLHQERADAEKRGKKQERVRLKHNRKLEVHNKVGDRPEGFFDEESSDHDHDTGNFYLTRLSDISNMSVKLGPGPVPIKLVDQSTQTSPLLIIRNNDTKLGMDDLRSVANISGSPLVSFPNEHRRGNKKKLKYRNSFRKNNAFVNWNDMFIPIKQSKKKIKTFHKHNSKIQQKDQEINENVGLNNKKYKNLNDESPYEIRGDKNKLVNNAQEQYANLSVINKSLQSAASKRFDTKKGYVNPSESEAPVNKEERTKIVVDKMSDEDAKKLCLLNAERELSVEQQTSLRDATAEVEKSNGNENSRRVQNKGIRSKIEHGDWLDHITFLPPPDYSVRKHGAHTKHRPSFENENKSDESAVEDKNHKRNKSQKKKILDDLFKKQILSKIEASAENLNGYELEPHSSDADGDVAKKRGERDINSRLWSHDSQSPIQRSIFNRRAETIEDEMNDIDTKHNSYSSFKNSEEDMYNGNSNSDKGDYYEYDSNLVESGKSATELCVANKTFSTPITKTTCVPTTEICTSTQTTRKPFKQKTTLQSNYRLENAGLKNNCREFTQKNNTKDSYEMFLNGNLADNFVAEVLKKVKSSKKMSRELGYGNETDETCDRCIELKPTNVPDLTVMRNSLGKCSRNCTPVQNCCAVPRPMLKYLDVLVYFEKENENNFYNKIQDDSSFIFTGDYPESLPKGGSITKMEDKFAEESSFSKNSIYGHLRDENEEKADEIASSNSHVNIKEKTSKEENTANVANFKENGIKQETKGEDKKHIRRFSKIKIDNKQDDTFLDIDKHARPTDLVAGLDEWELDPLAKENTFNEEPVRNNYYPHPALGKSWTNIGEKEGSHQGTLHASREPQRNPPNGFDRFYGKSNYDYFRQYPNKVSPIMPRHGYKLNHHDARNSLQKESRNRNSFYNIPIENDKTSEKDGQFKDSFAYHVNKQGEDQAMKFNGNYKEHQSKYDLYNDNGEYSLYPNLEDDSDRMSGKYKMVKRDTENPTDYDDEPSVLLEVPVVEYDLY